MSVAASRHLDAPVVGNHIDFFLGPAASAAHDRDARIARTYRLPLAAFAADAPVAGTYEAVELEPHRAEYLTLDAPRELSAGRGRVEPILRATGRASVHASAFEAEWDGWCARGARIEGRRWRIELARSEPQPSAQA